MRRFNAISGDISFQRYNKESWSIEIEITPDDVVPLFMEISLIQYDLVPRRLT